MSKFKIGDVVNTPQDLANGNDASGKIVGERGGFYSVQWEGMDKGGGYNWEAHELVLVPASAEHAEVDLRDIADQPQDVSSPPEYVGKDELIRELVEAAQKVIDEAARMAMTTRRRKIFDNLAAAIARAEGR